MYLRWAYLENTQKLRFRKCWINEISQFVSWNRDFSFDIIPYYFGPLIGKRAQLNVSDFESFEIAFEEENAANQGNT